MRQTRLSRGARRGRFWALAAMAAMLAGASALAAPQVTRGHGAEHFSRMMERPLAALVPAPTAERLVWEGADVDGDGQADFANPTGKPLRRTDAYGCGDFGASRDGGVRRHEGVDFRADADQPVRAPISGYVTKIGYAYAGDSQLKFVEISNPALRYAARVFYVDPDVVVGQAVRLGDRVGRHHTLEAKYPGGMTDHVHLELIDHSGERIDATRMITARWERAPVQRG
jgi:murein DD-endopeptidase MepM/ murein hydrolase activator NlpD